MFYYNYTCLKWSGQGGWGVLGARGRLCYIRAENRDRMGPLRKPYASQILSYKIFNFCERILKIGANDASGQMLYYAFYNMRQNTFLRKLQALEVGWSMIFSSLSRGFFSTRGAWSGEPRLLHGSLAPPPPPPRVLAGAPSRGRGRSRACRRAGGSFARARPLYNLDDMHARIDESPI